MYSYPKDKPSYWDIVDQYWPDLLNIIRRFAPDMVDEAQTAKQNQDAWVITDAFNMASTLVFCSTHYQIVDASFAATK